MAQFFRKTASCSTTSLKGVITKGIALFLLTLTSAAASHAGDTGVLQAYTAKYQLTNGALAATAERTLRKEGDHWRLSQNASVLFLKVDEESLIEEVDGALRPLSYQYHNNLRSKSDQNFVFDWQAGRVSDKEARRPWEKALKSGYQDQLSSQLALRHALITGTFDESLEQTLVAKKGKIKTYSLTRLGEERLETAIGTLDTVKLHRQRPGSSSEATLWLAPSLNYMIVKMEQIDDDERYALELLSVDLQGDK